MVKSHDSCVENCLRYYAPSLAKVLWMGFFKGERKLLRDSKALNIGFLCQIETLWRLYAGHFCIYIQW